MAEREDLRESLDSLARLLLGDATVAETLQRIVDVSAGAVPAAAYTGITMLVDEKVTTAVFSDPDVPEIDRAQYETGNGPCVDAFRNGAVYGIPSTERDVQWPEFSRTALSYGIRSTLSLPLTAAQSRLGALNFYSEQDHGFAEEDHRAAEAFATQAAVVLANLQTFWDARALGEHLREAMESRATIEQAKGIIIAQSRVGPEAAFEILRMASQRENRKLRDIARQIVERHSGGD
jgi:GAF domain-containing protein